MSEADRVRPLHMLDAGKIWDTIQNDLPPLLKGLEEILGPKNA